MMNGRTLLIKNQIHMLKNRKRQKRHSNMA
jgi:hypothetical protein